MYSLEEFDTAKTRVLKYILYKKRTENEVRIKFARIMQEDLLDDVIDYLKDAGYINDDEYVERQVNQICALKNLSLKITAITLAYLFFLRRDNDTFSLIACKIGKISSVVFISFGSVVVLLIPFLSTASDITSESSTPLAHSIIFVALFLKYLYK